MLIPFLRRNEDFHFRYCDNIFTFSFSFVDFLDDEHKVHKASVLQRKEKKKQISGGITKILKILFISITGSSSSINYEAIATTYLVNQAKESSTSFSKHLEFKILERQRNRTETRKRV